MLALLLVSPAVAAPTRPAGRPRSNAHLPQLDALRGLASIIVLLVHQRAVPQLRWLPHDAGTISLAAFFVLSGFLITRVLLAEKAAGRGLTAFYNRRAARIFPAYALTLVVLAAVSPGRELGWAATFSHNFRSWADARDYFVADAAAGPPIAHVWSLCVEEHFYWLWPLAVVLLPHRLLSAVLAAVVAGTPAVAYLLADRLRTAGLSPTEVEGLLSRSTLTQLVGLSAGGLIALHESRVTRPVVLGGVLLLLTAAGWAATAVASPDVRTAAHGTIIHLLGCGCFLVAFGMPTLGRSPILVFAGTVSYGLYLYHLPLYAALGLTDGAKPAAPLTGGLGLLLTFGLAWLSFRYLEKPVLARVRSGPAGRWRYAGAAVTAAAAVACAVSLTLAYREVRREAAKIVAPPPAEVTADDAPAAAPLTGFGATVTTLVVGSSHAEMGIATPEFADVAYNAGVSGQDPWYTNHLVRYYLARCPGLKRVVIEVNGTSIRINLSRCKPHLAWMQGVYYHAFGIRGRTDDERLYNPIPLAATPEGRAALALMRVKSELADATHRGWPPNMSKPFDPATAPAPMTNPPAGETPDEGFSAVWVRDNLPLLMDAVRQCQRRGVACVLVTPPTHAAFRTRMPPIYWSLWQRTVREIVRVTGVAHLDYETDPRFDTPDFYDGSHLGTAGAIKFTRILDADLNRVCPLPGR